jgi:hypothetical protein
MMIYSSFVGFTVYMTFLGCTLALVEMLRAGQVNLERSLAGIYMTPNGPLRRFTG